jgi:hypothetical protein
VSQLKKRRSRLASVKRVARKQRTDRLIAVVELPRARPDNDTGRRAMEAS